VNRLRKIGISIFAIVVMAVIIVIATPERIFSFHPTVLKVAKDSRTKIYAILQRTGTHQGSWRLFAPDPDRVNSRVQAVLYFEDQSEVKWISPDYLDFDLAKKFANQRRMEYYDNLQAYQDSGGVFSYKKYFYVSYFDPLCSYLAKKNEQAGRRVTRAELMAIRSVIPEPSYDKPLLPVGGSWVDERLEFLTSVMYDLPFGDQAVELEPWPPEDQEEEIEVGPEDQSDPERSSEEDEDSEDRRPVEGALGEGGGRR